MGEGVWGRKGMGEGGRWEREGRKETTDLETDARKPNNRGKFFGGGGRVDAHCPKRLVFDVASKLTCRGTALGREEKRSPAEVTVGVSL
jgi:hypothetical protein